MTRRRLLGAIAAVGLALASAVADAASPASFWEEILARYVEPDGRVDYAGIHRLARMRLSLFIEALADTEVDALGPRDRTAFWINAHNAAVVAAVIDGERATTLDRRARMFHWYPTAVAGRKRTIDDLANAARTSAAGDVRIHFALFFGVETSPALAPAPYRGSTLDTELERAERAFVNDPRHVKIDRAAATLELSPLFRWHRRDFENTAGTLGRFLRAKLEDAPPDLDGYQIRFREPDWSIRDPPRRRRATAGRAGS